jgi:predicted esterase
MPTVHSIAAHTHGRYLVDATSATQSLDPLIVGFHGYAEDAEIQLARLRAMTGTEACELVSIQALHRFYRGRSQQIVASWMTSQDRDTAIADNLAYVASVLEARISAAPSRRLVFAGFSQGVAMAFRAACAWGGISTAVALGGDVPPDLNPASLARLPAVLLARNRDDTWYTAAKWESDLARLRNAGVGQVASLEVQGVHDWTAEFSAAAGRYLTDLWRSPLAPTPR